MKLGLSYLLKNIRVRKAQKFLFGRRDGKRLPAIYGCRMEYNIRIDLMELGWLSVK